MGKSLNGKELGNRISQKKDGLYQTPFTLHTLFLEMEKFEKKCKKGVKMVISAAGMAICLLCGGCAGQDAPDTEQNLFRLQGRLLARLVA